MGDSSSKALKPDCYVPGYKVLRVSICGSWLHSVSAPASARVYYKPGEVTIPPEHGGALAVFDDLDLARQFIDINWPTIDMQAAIRIYKCLYAPPRWVSEDKSGIYCITNGRFDFPADVPRGTCVAIGVKLTEQLTTWWEDLNDNVRI